MGISFIVGWYLVMALGRRDGLAEDKLGVCFIWTGIAAVLGARLLFIITNYQQFAETGLWELVAMRRGGLVAYGGFLGGFLGSWLYLRRQQIRILAWADAVVPGLGAGLGITRIGCFLYGCDHGKPIPTDAPDWLRAIGVQFPNWKIAFPDWTNQFKDAPMGCATPLDGAPAFNLHLYELGLVRVNEAYSALVYPTQLMEVLNGWVAFGLVMWVRRRKTFVGQAFLAFTAYYGLTRAAMELLRGDTQRGGIGIFSTSQLIGGATFLAALVAWIVLKRK